MQDSLHFNYFKISHGKQLKSHIYFLSASSRMERFVFMLIDPDCYTPDSCICSLVLVSFHWTTFALPFATCNTTICLKQVCFSRAASNQCPLVRDSPLLHLLPVWVSTAAQTPECIRTVNHSEKVKELSVRREQVVSKPLYKGLCKSVSFLEGQVASGTGGINTFPRPHISR